MAAEVKTVIKPLGDRVVVKRIEEEPKTKGGIVLPDTAKEKPQRGTVVAAGPGKPLDNGERQAALLRLLAGCPPRGLDCLLGLDAANLTRLATTGPLRLVGDADGRVRCHGGAPPGAARSRVSSARSSAASPPLHPRLHPQLHRLLPRLLQHKRLQHPPPQQ